MKKNIVFLLILIPIIWISCDGMGHQTIDFRKVEDLMPQHPDSALTLLEQIENKENLSRKDKARYYLLLTEAQNKNHIPHINDSLITIATDYYEKTDDVERKAKAWFYKGRINQDLNHPLKAQEYYLKALGEEERIKNHALLGRINNNIGMLYTRQMVYETALTFQKKAVENFRVLGDSTRQVFALRDLGRNYVMLHLQDSALACYKSALKLMQDKKVISIYSELGSLLIHKEDYPQAYAYLNLALAESTSKRINYPLYLILGNYFLQTGKLDSALVYLQPCLKNENTRASAAHRLAILAERQGDLKSSVNFYKQYQIFRDSVYEQKQTESIRKMQDLYNYHESDKKLSEAYRAIDKLKITRLYMALCITIVCAFLLLNHSRQKIKNHLIKQQQQKIKEMKNDYEDLNNKLLENQHYTQDLQEKIKTLEKQEAPNQLMLLRKEQLENENKNITRTIECQKNLEHSFLQSELCIRFQSKESWKPTAQDWSDLYQNIDLAYNNFTFRLKNLTNKLTEKDLKVSCLIKAQVPPSIIGNLLNCTTTSISMTRVRLYKKIHKKEGSTKQLDEFIQRF